MAKIKNQAHFTIAFEKSRTVRPDANLKSFTLKIQESRNGPGDVWIMGESTEIKDSDKIKALLINT